jgi:uncharacterized protein YqgQ
MAVDRFRKIAIKILKPIENQIYLPQREVIIEAIVKELEKAYTNGVSDGELMLGAARLKDVTTHAI